jgi:hypothetical protein
VKARNKKIEDTLDLMLIINGAMCAFLGCSGILLIVFSMLKMSQVLYVAFGFVSTYLLVIGVFLLAFHKHIIVRPKRHYYYDSRYFG